MIISVSQLLGNLSMWPYLRGNICRVKLTTRKVMKHTFVEILIGAIVYVIVLVVLRDAFVCKYIDKTFHKILGQRRK